MYVCTIYMCIYNNICPHTYPGPVPRKVDEMSVLGRSSCTCGHISVQAIKMQYIINVESWAHLVLPFPWLPTAAGAGARGFDFVRRVLTWEPFRQKWTSNQSNLQYAPGQPNTYIYIYICIHIYYTRIKNFDQPPKPVSCHTVLWWVIQESVYIYTIFELHVHIHISRHIISYHIRSDHVSLSLYI